MFGIKKKQLVEQPLGYWEEDSYLLALTDDNKNFGKPDDMVDRVKTIDGVEVIESGFKKEDGVLEIRLKYKDKEYDVRFGPHPYEIPDFMFNTLRGFSPEETERLKKTKFAMSIIMKFTGEPKKDFHLQLKIAAAALPDFLGYLDESQEKIFPPKWVMLAAKSNVEPAPNNLFTVQVIPAEKSNEVWLHTHGLCRCGLTELEILGSDRENYQNHYHLISAYAAYLIDNVGSFDYKTELAFIGLLGGQVPVLAVCRPWTEALGEYKKLELGGAKDRESGHNSRTSPIFIASPNEKDKGKLIKVSELNDLWGNNPVYFFSTAETNRMKALAMERFDYAKKAFENPEYKVLIKIGLVTDHGEDEDSREHAWFELLGFEGEKFRAKLTQDTYDVSSMHKDDEGVYGVEDVTDWLILTPGLSISPNEVYLLKD